ncbi:protein SHQ1 homolog [Saccoglossus kowalevskii]|uniref:Protein SHQ1 homolog n=1 Tax=Saccoglossus kowalevskii TaxID=10224 RepID=A0ABM0MHH9_SACKO|nr:PREDICTED: protein SHQ1 homolog [Saccoglossus kowalevskii]
MLTPAFEISQDDSFLNIIIKAKFAKVADTEMYIDGDEFKFYSKPYYLRLNLPGRIVEDGRETANYDINTGYFNIRIPKENPGENFDGLDMLTKLLAPKGKTSAAQPLIQVVGETSCVDDGEEEEFDWQIEQEQNQEIQDTVISDVKYGFANLRSGVFKTLMDELSGAVDIPDPDNTGHSKRRKQRIEDEREHFDEAHYLADLYDDAIIQQILEYQPTWNEQYKQLKSKEKQNTEKQSVYCVDESIVPFSEEEKEQMIKLPKKEYLSMDQETHSIVYFGLVDIIFAYIYNHRSTEGDNTVESAWTICKLSSTLSWFDSFSSLYDVIVSCYTRIVCYPLYRHWHLAEVIHDDTIKIFKLGKRKLLSCLLEIHKLLSKDDTKYLLNDLYITDYTVWIQSASHDKIESLANALKQVKITKSDLGLELDELEHAATLVEAEENTTEDIVQGMENITIHQYGYPGVMHMESSKENCNVDQSAVGASDGGLLEHIAQMSLLEQDTCSDDSETDDSDTSLSEESSNYSNSDAECSVGHSDGEKTDLQSTV